jgi:uncharacterized membrane protein YbhN (UPF0104 family)
VRQTSSNPSQSESSDDYRDRTHSWIVLWALLAWLNAGLNLLLEPEARSAVWEQSRLLVILNYAALSVAIVITLWGTARIARRLEALRASTSKISTSAHESRSTE